MIELSDIKKAFNQGKPNEYWALHGIDLALEAGKVTAFRGPSGSGKTTLLTIVGCLSRPTSGRRCNCASAGCCATATSPPMPSCRCPTRSCTT